MSTSTHRRLPAHRPTEVGGDSDWEDKYDVTYDARSKTTKYLPKKGKHGTHTVINAYPEPYEGVPKPMALRGRVV